MQPQRAFATIVTAALLLPSGLDATVLSDAPTWVSGALDGATAIAWGDHDLDGWIDLAAGSGPGAPARVLRNIDGDLITVWSSTELDDTRAVAWADWDRDGDLDLAVGNAGPNRLYENVGGLLTLAWSSTEPDDTTDLAWADFDGDGDLDLAVANGTSEADRLYRNDAGTLVLAWSSAELEVSEAVAWGYLDGDALPDLAVAAYGSPSRVYVSDGLSLALTWTAPAIRSTRDVAWVDSDRDGDFDLVLGNDGEPDQVYRNDDGTLELDWETTEAATTRAIAAIQRGGESETGFAAGTGPGEPVHFYLFSSRGTGLSWSSPTSESTRDVAWADLDRDGDLDLTVANDSGDPTLIYPDVWYLLNGWRDILPGIGGGASVALGDWDCDGDLDLVTGGFYNPIAGGTTPVPKEVFENIGGDVPFERVFVSDEADISSTVRWGDADGDGDLDLAVGNRETPNQLYRNDGGGALTLSWTAAENDWTADIAWGDPDQDGDLDLIVASLAAPLRLYRNDGTGGLSLVWSSAAVHRARGVAWADWDGDGDLDIAVATDEGEPSHVYQNDAGLLSLAWSSTETDGSVDVAWGDLDGDGRPDLAVANIEADRIYRNDGGSLSVTWTSPSRVRTNELELVDWDGDGDLDLAAATRQGFEIRLQRAGDFVAVPNFWTVADLAAIALGDLDDDGDLEIVTTTRNDHFPTAHGFSPTSPRPRVGLPETAAYPVIDSHPGTTASGSLISSAERLGSPVLISYVLVDHDSDRVPRLVAEYSPVGGGHWLPATEAQGGDGIRDLTTDPSGAAHVFAWDAAADGVVSDNVVFRVSVPQIPGRIGHPIVHDSQTDTSRPFRVDASLGRHDRVALLSVASPVSGVDVIDEVDDPNLSQPGSIGNLVCPPPGVGEIDSTGPRTIVRCRGLDVPAAASVFVSFEATIDQPYEPRRAINGTSIQRVCNAAAAGTGGRCDTTAPVCVDVLPRFLPPRLTKVTDGWDDTDMDGEVDRGEGIWFRIELCNPQGSDGPTRFTVRDNLAPETTLTYDSLTTTKGTIRDWGPAFEVYDIDLPADPDPAISCAEIRFRTWVGDVDDGTDVCNLAAAEWIHPLTLERVWVFSNGDDPSAPTACFTVDGGCDTSSLPLLDSLTVANEPGGVRISWDADPLATTVHVNSVTIAEEMAGDGPQRSPAGAGRPQCEVSDGSVSCLDDDAFTDGETLLFYRAMAACGTSGFDEGPP